MQFINAILLAIPAVMASEYYQADNSYPGGQTPQVGNTYQPAQTGNTYQPAQTGNTYQPAQGYNSQKHCVQEWFGTAPLCDGRCPSGWTLVRNALSATHCDKDTDAKKIEHCQGTSGNECWHGMKALCEQCY
ncbi:hypothetical protein TWF694_008157 [Orbilia ellipsospora]|uniref:Uncharacterized protein n=1 Tax=Orbilia ellipsospora TaxID=2528407 RepID=A0AAV9XFB4_9PEZI